MPPNPDPMDGGATRPMGLAAMSLADGAEQSLPDGAEQEKGAEGALLAPKTFILLAAEAEALA
jgi:hypothetical protein